MAQLSARSHHGVAQKLATLAGEFLGDELPIGIRAWDGSSAGPVDGPILVIADRRALRRLLWSPNELGIAQAYISGEIDVDGDLADGLRLVWRHVRAHTLRAPALTLRQRLRVARDAATLGALGAKPAAPNIQAKLTGQLHSQLRDRAVIGYHYDLSNSFYELLLDENMTYSCGYWRQHPGPDYGLAQAQHDKLELICRKLGVRDGTRLLDVGCGWGALAIHAARHHGARVTGVTLSAQQRDYAVARAAAAGLADLVEIRLQDYRDITDGPYDAVSCIEMGEHVGDEQYPQFVVGLLQLLRPQGRLLLQQMSRGHHHPGGGAFIESYVAPDMHMRPVGETIAYLEGAGFEVRDVHGLREHYVHTVAAWNATLHERFEDAVALVGEPMARVWLLYLAGGSLAFEENRMGVDQILAVRPGEHGEADMPSTRTGFEALSGV